MTVIPVEGEVGCPLVTHSRHAAAKLESAQTPGLISDAGYSLERLGQDLAAVDHKLLTRDVRRFIGCEEQHGIAYVLDGAQSLQWNRGCHCPQIVFAQSLQAFRDDVARHDCINGRV